MHYISTAIHIYTHTYIQVVGVISKIAEHKTSIKKESMKDLKTGSQHKQTGDCSMICERQYSCHSLNSSFWGREHL